MNGRVAALGESADPERDRIEVDGRRVDLAERAYWVLHKPRGVVSTRSDPQGRPTLLALLPPAARRLRLFPVGRLDLDSEGLVLLTNDGALAQRLLHPSYESEKEYLVTVRGAPSPTALRRLADGLVLEPGERRTAPARVERVGRPAAHEQRAGGGASAREERAGSASTRAHARRVAAHGQTQLRIVLREGRKRQIRRSLAQLGHPVRRLVRVRIGPLRLGDLAPGAARALRPRERAALLRYAAERRADAQLAPQAGAAASESRRPRKPREPSRRERRSH